jgi:hypothetical protein
MSTSDEGGIAMSAPDAVDSNSGGDVASEMIATPATTTTTTNVVLKYSNSLSTLGDASGVAFLLGNHAEFGLAERCW